MHLNAVGGDCPGKTELHADILRCAARAHRRGVRAAGANRGRDSAARRHPRRRHRTRRRIARASARARRDDRDVTIFDSVGFALEDFSALRYLRAIEPRAGRRPGHRPRARARRSEGSVRRAEARRHAGVGARHAGDGVSHARSLPSPRTPAAVSSARPPMSARAIAAPRWVRRRCASRGCMRRCKQRGFQVVDCGNVERPAEPRIVSGSTAIGICARWRRGIARCTTAVYRELEDARLPILLGGDHSLSHRLHLGGRAPLPRSRPGRCGCCGSTRTRTSTRAN